MITLPGRVLLVGSFIPFSTLNISHPSILACKVSAEKSVDSFMRIPLYVTSCFSLAVFKILSLTFDILITMCLCMDLFGNSLGFQNLQFCLFSQVKEVFSHCFFKLNFLLLFSPSGTPIIWMLFCLKSFHRYLGLSLLFLSFFFFFFTFCCSYWVNSIHIV